MEEAIVESFTALFKTDNGTPFWYEVRLKGINQPFALHVNAGKLRVGERVRFIRSKAQLGPSGSQGINRKGWLLFDKLERVEDHQEELDGGLHL